MILNCTLTKGHFFLCVVKSFDYVLEPSPVPLPLSEPLQTRVIQVSCGRAHSLVLTDQEGGKTQSQSKSCQFLKKHVSKMYIRLFVCIFPLSTVYSMGNNSYGQCGRTIVEDEVYRFVPNYIKSTTFQYKNKQHPGAVIIYELSLTSAVRGFIDDL